MKSIRLIPVLLLVVLATAAQAQRPLGGDVSHWEGAITWSSVKNAGYVFSWAKATEGTNYIDPTFTANASGAKTAGVLIAPYHFARYDENPGTNGAIAEAQYFWATAKNYITNNGYYMMPMLDAEYVTTNGYEPGHYGYTKTTFSQWLNAWATTVVSNAAAKGVTIKPVLYCGVSFSANWMDSTITNTFSPWVATWNHEDPQTGAPGGTGPFSSWNFWQWSATNIVPGISGQCDVDVYNGNAVGLTNHVIGSIAAPLFVSQPSSRYGDRGGSLAMSVWALGAPTLKYQWRFNGVAISGATNSAYTLTNIQTTSAGSYTVICSNTFGSITSAVSTVTVNRQFTPIFTDNFDANSSANWTVTKSSTDTRSTFAYNYSVIGVPSAPNATNGTTSGLRLEANLKNSVVAALSASPNGQTFSAPYRLHFDMWLNVNGPLPGGGNGSTEMVTAGIGTAGGRVQWNNTGATADGVWFSVDGDGGVGSGSTTQGDFVAYIATNQQAVTSGVYTATSTRSSGRSSSDYYYGNVFPAGTTPPLFQQTNYAQQTGSLTVGAVGLKWRDVVVDNDSTNVTWYVDGLKLASVSASSITASNIFVGYWDPFTSLSDNTNLSFGLIDNVRVEVPVVAPLISAQPASATVTQGSNALFSVTATGSPTPTYQWRFNGGAIVGATASSYAKTNAQPADVGSYSVVVSNISSAVTSGSAVLAVNVPASISAQPQSLAVNVSSNAVFSVTASGTAPLSYQWRLNGVSIGGAIASSYTKTNVQNSDAGSYSVMVTNVAGVVTSSDAILSVNQAPSITTQPQSHTVSQNSSATFSVSATGTAALGYQWRFNNVSISGATASSYALSHVQSSNAGSYSVVITNMAGSVTSFDATLTLSPCAIHLLNVTSNSDGTIGLTWTTDLGNNYSFQYADSLSNAQWITSGAYAASGSTLTVNVARTNAQQFYRLASDCTASEVAGFVQLNLLGNSDSYVSLPFVRPPSASATVASVVGNTITVTIQYPTSWTSNQFVYAAGAQSNNFYILFTTGNAQGPVFPITANGTNSVTVDTSNNSLSTVAVGDLFVIEPYWTLNSVFPNGAGVNVSPTVGNRNTEVLIPDYTSSGINLSASKVYFFNAGIWKQVGQGSVDHGNDVLPMNLCFIVRHNVATNTTLLPVGVADASSWKITLRAPDGSAGDKQDNFVSLTRPTGVSLDASGLITSGAFATSPLPGSRTDELLIFDNSVAAKNKSSSAVYYYWNNAWRRVGFGSAIVGSDTVFNPGSGVIVRRGTNSVSPAWINSSPY
ncbi:MAG: Endoglucanase [Verrucomicrobiales bacterium]|nr:Endoglucanase [Verrucomicrobiales bacterium]